MVTLRASLGGPVPLNDLLGAAILGHLAQKYLPHLVHFVKGVARIGGSREAEE